MAIRKKGPAGPDAGRPGGPHLQWVGSAAGFIGDPVRRLRFLRAVAPLAGVAAPRRPNRRGRIALLAALAAGGLITFFLARAAARVVPAERKSAARAAAAPKAARTEVWRVEQKRNAETYSNGLRIEEGAAVRSAPRSYLAFPAGGGPPERRSQPAGIVFHSTESRQAPFEAGHNEELKKLGESLLEYIRRRRCYHFLVDRFGRVYRVVAETDTAHHAGHSVWAGDRWLYIDLNDSFLGVALEAQSGDAEGEATAAQRRSTTMLTEMLRSRYGIAAGNCVTHAQVSVNPSNMRVGYHVDWGANFPYAELGLPDNYAAPLPAVWAFGFEWDAAFLGAVGEEMRDAAARAEETLRERAAGAGLSARTYRAKLRREYRERLQTR